MAHPTTRIAPLVALLLAACGDPEAPAPERQVEVVIRGERAVAETDPRYLSFAVDTAQVVGGVFWDPAGGGAAVPVAPFDFARPALRRLARELAPALLRIGGTAADETYVDLAATGTPPAPPVPYRWTLTRAQWDGLADFAGALGLDLLVTLNAGLGPRGGGKAWSPENARALVRHAVARGHPVDVWELGNELNAFLLLYGFSLEPAQYAADLKAARAMIVEEGASPARLAGPSCAFWPKAGDFIGTYGKLMPVAGPELGLVTWHYYPQQSLRCPLATRRAALETLLDPVALDEVGRWSDEVAAAASQHAPGREIWLGETGNAQCGGEPGVSDAFVGSLWWLDQLGLLARRGNTLVIRQTLAGSNYGLLDDATLRPNPDYWASLLFKRTMGTRVLALEANPPDARLRLYAHCARGDGAGAGGATLLALNLDRETPARVRLAGAGSLLVYAVSAESLRERAVRLNGAPLEAAADGTPPELVAAPARAWFDLPPASYAFLVWPEAGLPACR
jgi:heparanase 1